MHRPARCRDREWTVDVDDPQPDRHTGPIDIRGEFLGSLNAFQLGRLARIRAIDPSRTTNTRTGLSTWEGGRRNLRFADSLLEGDGFELFVPLGISASPSWWSRERKPHGAPEGSFSVAGPMVRIHLPPAGNLRTFGSAGDFAGSVG